MLICLPPTPARHDKSHPLAKFLLRLSLLHGIFSLACPSRGGDLSSLGKPSCLHVLNPSPSTEKVSPAEADSLICNPVPVVFHIRRREASSAVLEKEEGSSVELKGSSFTQLVNSQVCKEELVVSLSAQRKWAAFKSLWFSGRGLFRREKGAEGTLYCQLSWGSGTACILLITKLPSVPLGLKFLNWYTTNWNLTRVPAVCWSLITRKALIWLGNGEQTNKILCIHT